jgi:hypothetical protein
MQHLFIFSKRQCSFSEPEISLQPINIHRRTHSYTDKNHTFIGIQKDSWPLKRGRRGFPETSVINYHYSLRNNSEECSSYLLRGEFLKSHKLLLISVLRVQTRLDIIREFRCLEKQSLDKNSFPRLQLLCVAVIITVCGSNTNIMIRCLSCTQLVTFHPTLQTPTVLLGSVF